MTTKPRITMAALKAQHPELYETLHGIVEGWLNTNEDVQIDFGLQELSREQQVVGMLALVEAGYMRIERYREQEFDAFGVVVTEAGVEFVQGMGPNND